MSTIDQYKHHLLGFIECPSNHDFVGASETKTIAIYVLLQDIPDYENDFDGRPGDILVGGGSGEAAALRIATEKCLKTFMLDEVVDIDHRDELFKAFWTPTESYMYGEGFIKLGWKPDESNLESWLARNVCKILTDEIDEYSSFRDGRESVSDKFKWHREWIHG